MHVVRKLSVVFVMALLAFLTACSSSSSSTSAAASGTGTAAAAGTCPTSCKVFVAPARKFSAALTALVGKAKSGGINPSDVDGASSALTDVHNAATSGGADFTDNASITG